MQFLSDRDVKLFGGTEQLLSCHSAVIARALGSVLSCAFVKFHGRGTCGFRSSSCLAAGCNFLSNRVVKLLGGTEQLLSCCLAVIAWVLGQVLPGGLSKHCSAVKLLGGWAN